MIKKITQFLKTKRSYLKKGDAFLAEKFGCSETTVRMIKRDLANVKRNYIASL